MKKLVFVLFLALAPVQVFGGNPLVNPIHIVDPVRSIVGFILSLINIGEDPVMAAWLNVTQEQVAAAVEGDRSYVTPQGTGSPATEVPVPTYEYVQEKIFSNSNRTPYAPLNSKIAAGGDMEEAVKEVFFYSGDDLDETKRKEIEKKRKEYVVALGKEYVKMAYEVQQKVIENMSALGTNIGGNGTIGAVSSLDQTWKSVNRSLIADIALQIQLMELDAARFLSAQPVQIMSETPPEAPAEQ